MCEVFEKMDGRYFSDFVRPNFRQIVHVSTNPNSRFFVKVCVPNHNSKANTEIESWWEVDLLKLLDLQV